MKSFSAEAEDRALLDHLAVIVAPGGVCRLHRLHLGDVARHQEVHEAGRVLAADRIFDQRRNVVDGGAGAGREVLGLHRIEEGRRIGAHPPDPAVAVHQRLHGRVERRLPSGRGLRCWTWVIVRLPRLECDLERPGDPSPLPSPTRGEGGFNSLRIVTVPLFDTACLPRGITAATASPLPLRERDRVRGRRVIAVIMPPSLCPMDFRISRAAFAPAAPETLPPGWAPAPQSQRPGIGNAVLLVLAGRAEEEHLSSVTSPWCHWPPARPNWVSRSCGVSTSEAAMRVRRPRRHDVERIDRALQHLAAGFIWRRLAELVGRVLEQDRGDMLAARREARIGQGRNHDLERGAYRQRGHISRNRRRARHNRASAPTPCGRCGTSRRPANHPVRDGPWRHSRSCGDAGSAS